MSFHAAINVASVGHEVLAGDYDSDPCHEELTANANNLCRRCCHRLMESARCPYCGAVPEDYEEEDERPWEERRFRGRRDAEPHRGVLILVLGIISIVLVAIACGPVGLPLGIAAWVMGHKDLRKMRENIMDDEGMGLTQAGWICGIIGTILDTFCR